jgi:hypothetical protein
MICCHMNENLRRHAAQISDLAAKYLWWDPIGDRQHSIERSVAQVMNFGTYDDILRLEQLVSASDLTNIMVKSQPGWFDDRSWDFWRGRLSVDTTAEIPTQRPRRTFADAQVF